MPNGQKIKNRCQIGSGLSAIAVLVAARPESKPIIVHLIAHLFSSRGLYLFFLGAS
jgi:hypothetical protein